MIHLNITLDPELYRRIKERVAPKKLSAFIADAVREKLGPSLAELEQAYREASKEPWRQELAGDWMATECEEWPD